MSSTFALASWKVQSSQLICLHVLAEPVQKALDHVYAAVRRKAEMLDAPLVALRGQIGVSVILILVEIGVDVEFADIVKEIEVKIVGAALFELFFKDLLRLAHVGQIIAGELARQIKAVARIGAQQFADDVFGLAVVVAPRGVEIVDAVRDRVVEHLLCRRLVDVGVIPAFDRKPHRPEAECGQLFALEVSVYHISSSAHARPMPLL